MAEARQDEHAVLLAGRPPRKRVARRDPTVLAVQSSMLVCPQCASVYTRELDYCGLDGERLVESHEDPLIGRTIDRYRVVASVGAGGMARVYKAEHVYLEQHFALKVLHGEIASDRDLSRRFHREAKALCRIKHENIVSVADFGATREGLLFMVMEYLDGPTLSAVLRAQGSLRASRAAFVTHQLAAGLSAAHRQGYVHRDLKPGNVVLIDKNGGEHAKILDFGLVRIVERESEPTRLTQHGMFFGTPAYMAPEQITGEEAGPSADLYALGVLLYHMLTGSLPFEGDVKALAHHHVSSTPARPDDDHGGLSDLALNLLAKSPADRPASARDVIERLNALPVFSDARPRPAPPRPQLSEIAEDVQLSTPVIAEERSLIEETEGQDARDMTRSVREHVGIGARIASWLPFALFVVFAVLVSWWFLREHVGTDAPPAPPPPVPQPSPVETSKRRATPEKRTEKTVRRSPPSRPAEKVPPAAPPRTTSAKAAPSRKPAVPRRAPPPPPVPPRPEPAAAGPPEPRPRVETIDTVVERLAPAEPLIFDRSFKELDLALGWALSKRGLAWEDLATAAPSAARRWSGWYRTTETPPVLDLTETYRALEAAVDRIEVDAPLLQVKLARIRHGLESAKGFETSARLGILQDRYRRLRREVGRIPLPRTPRDLAAELTNLESDVKVLEAEVRKRREALPKPALEIPRALLAPGSPDGP